MSSIVSLIKGSAPTIVRLLLILALCADLSAAAEERAALTSQEEAAWREQGFSPSDAGEWKYFGIGPNDARKWINAGIQFPGWANQWIGEGFSPEEAAKWKDLTNVYTAGKFLRYGFSASEAKSWMDRGVKSALRAKEYRESGISAEEGGGFWGLGLYPEDVKAWHDAGFTPQETLDWHFGPKDVAYFHTKETPYSREVYPLKWAMEWKGAGFSYEEARKAGSFRVKLEDAVRWRGAGFSFDETVKWLDSGFDISGALERKVAGVGLVEAEKARDETGEKTGDEISEIHYDLDLKKDGKLNVSMRLELINRSGGAYSDTFYIPVPEDVTLRYRGSHIRSASPTYKVRYAELDGVGIDYYIKKGRLHIGKEGVPLANGSHTIRVSYTTDDRVLTFADHDELYFPVIKELTDLKIDNASATVRLPKGAQIIFADGYAGLEGRKDFTVSVKETEYGDVAGYEVTRPLRKRMQFTLSVAFLKGYLDLGPMHELRLIDRQEGHIFTSFAMFLSGFIILTGYYYFIWRRVGRDPKGSTVITAYDPPDNMGPAEMRQLYTRGKVDDLSIVSSILRLAETGGLNISERQGVYRIERGQTVQGECTPLEKGFLENVFSGTEGLIIGHAGTRKTIGAAVHLMRTELRKGFKDLLKTNKRYLWPGVAISLATLLLSLAVLDLDNYGKEKIFKNIYLCLMIAALGGVNLIFKRLLRSPTEAYVRLLERIQGYRSFLESSFKKEAGQSGGIPPSLQRHLPYAVALGIDCRRVTIRQGQAGWYSGSSGPFNVGEFCSSINKKG